MGTVAECPAEQLNDIFELKPPSSTTVMEAVPLCPSLTATDAFPLTFSLLCARTSRTKIAGRLSVSIDLPVDV